MTIEYYIAKRTGKSEKMDDSQDKSLMSIQYQVLVPAEDAVNADFGPAELLLRTIGLPLPGQPFRKGNRILRVAQHTVERSRTHIQVFFVDVRWEWPYVQAIKDPRNEFFPPSITAWKRQVALTKDAQTGKVLANSAGAPLSQFPMVDQGDQAISWKRIEDWYNQEYADLFWDKINSSPVTIFGKTFAAGTVRCESIVGIPDYKTVDLTGNGQTLKKIFYEVTYSLIVNRNGWKFKWVDMGNAVLKNGKLVVPTLEGGAPAREAVKLDGAGAQLPAGEDPVMLEAWEYAQADFSLMNLPAQLPAFLLE
jgi:hypothetical protein